MMSQFLVESGLTVSGLLCQSTAEKMIEDKCYSLSVVKAR